MKFLSNKEYQELKDGASRVKQLESQIELIKKDISIDGKRTIVTPGPSSARDIPVSSAFDVVQASLRVLPTDVQSDIVVPLIRQLVKVNPDASQALNDFVRLANTGHKIKFDPSVGESQVEDMRNFILESSKSWHVGAAGMNGIVNKMLRQVQIGGASSIEWIPNLDLNNLEECRFVNPETIRFVVDKNYKSYQPYQRPHFRHIIDNIKNLRKLNQLQFKYFALNGDTDLPYGYPPYLAALDSISTQKHMVDNIKFIVTLLGAFGYVSANMEKPDQQAGETDEAYLARLKKLLQEFKQVVQSGTRDGVLVGFKDDHEFEFKETTKNASGVKEIFEQNELLVAAGLGTDPVFMGRPGGTETLVTVMFQKMLSQLRNTQDIISEQLEFGYKFALTLGGFKFKRLHVEFNKSTLTDDLKYQQAQEIKIRNLNELYDQGQISQDQYADEMNLIKPDQQQPRITREQKTAGSQPDGKMSPSTKKSVKDGKNKSAKKGRDKNNPRGTVKRQNVKDDDTKSH